jgi:hypothetical protein
MTRSARACILSAFLATSSTSVFAQSGPQSLEGMWSDPPFTPEDDLCRSYCTQMGLDYLDALLSNPEYDDRSFAELRNEIREYQSTEYFRPRLSAAALATFPLDPLMDDPGYLYCERWGLARQIFVPHQLELQRFDDRIEMRYGEWEATRTIYTDGRALLEDPEPTLLGYSVGHFEGDTLVIETTGIRANITIWRGHHSDQLRVTERYVRDGDRLLMTATMDDPWGLMEPLELKKVWEWAPDQQIYPYVDCVPAIDPATAGRE